MQYVTLFPCANGDEFVSLLTFASALQRVNLQIFGSVQSVNLCSYTALKNPTFCILFISV